MSRCALGYKAADEYRRENAQRAGKAATTTVSLQSSGKKKQI